MLPLLPHYCYAQNYAVIICQGQIEGEKRKEVHESKKGRKEREDETVLL